MRFVDAQFARHKTVGYLWVNTTHGWVARILFGQNKAANKGAG